MRGAGDGQREADCSVLFMKETAHIFAEKTSFIKDQEVFEKLLAVRSQSAETASLFLNVMQDIQEIKDAIATKTASCETKSGWKTERSTKFVYLFRDINDTKMHKIGISKNVRQRSMGVGCKVDILAVGFGGDELEFQLHKRLHEKRRWHLGSYEWFILEKDEAQFVKNCIDEGRIIDE